MIDNPLQKVAKAKFLLGNVEIDPVKNTILKNGEEISAEPRLIRVIEKLVENQGEVVSREELLKEISGNAVIGDESLTQAISKIRQYLGDIPSRPQFIKTIPKKGYLVIVPVTEMGSSNAKETMNRELNIFKILIDNKFQLTIVALLCLVIFIAISSSFKTDNPTFNEQGEREFIEKGEREFIEKEK